MMTVRQSDPVNRWRLGADLGEGPVWVERDRALWFVDIKGPRIHRFRPDGDEQASWEAPEQVGFCLPTDRGDFVVGLQSGLARFDPEGGTFTPMVDPEPDHPGNRLNDATIDPAGRLWFGTMDDAERAATGRIYRLDEGNRCIAVSQPVTVSNGPAFSPDGRTLYHVDTLGGTIYAIGLSEAGEMTGERIFTRIDAADGYPDGPTVDAEGCLWVGLYMGHAVRRYSPAGELLETVPFPVSAITKLAFGGQSLTTIYATTAAKHLTTGEREAEGQAGDLFSFEVSVPGLASVAMRSL